MVSECQSRLRKEEEGRGSVRVRGGPEAAQSTRCSEGERTTSLKRTGDLWTLVVEEEARKPQAETCQEMGEDSEVGAKLCRAEKIKRRSMCMYDERRR